MIQFYIKINFVILLRLLLVIHLGYQTTSKVQNFYDITSLDKMLNFKIPIRRYIRKTIGYC